MIQKIKINGYWGHEDTKRLEKMHRNGERMYTADGILNI